MTAGQQISTVGRSAANGKALTPLIWEHVNPYGRQELDMRTRIAALA